MDEFTEQRKLGDDLFAEMVSDIKNYIHERFLADRKVPAAFEILSDMDYTGITLNQFLEGIRNLRPVAAHQFTYRLYEMVRSAKFQYEGEEVA